MTTSIASARRGPVRRDGLAGPQQRLAEDGQQHVAPGVRARTEIRRPGHDLGARVHVGQVPPAVAAGVLHAGAEHPAAPLSTLRVSPARQRVNGSAVRVTWMPPAVMIRPLDLLRIHLVACFLGILSPGVRQAHAATAVAGDGRFWVSEHAKPATAYRRRHHWREAGLGRMAVSLASAPAAPALTHARPAADVAPSRPARCCCAPRRRGGRPPWRSGGQGDAAARPGAISWPSGRAFGHRQPEHPVYLVAVHRLLVHQQVRQPVQVTLMGADERDRALFPPP